MIRRLFHFLCALSVVLCVVTVALWVRSYSIREDISWQSTKRLTSFACSQGEFLVATAPGTVVRKGVHRWAFPANDLAGNFSEAVGTMYLLGIGFGRASDGKRTETDLMLPLWFIELLFLAPLMLTGWDHYKRRGRCRKCGYDLRASKERCPECGTPIRAKPEKAAPSVR